jgi:DNA ligase-1
MMRKKPMLAYPVSDKPIDYTKPVFMQPKLDGVRCLIQYEQVTPLQTGPVAYSRTGKRWKNIDHILQSLEPFFQANPNVILDGELYNHALRDDFEKIISCVRKTKPTAVDRAESRKLVQFHCYDIVDEALDFQSRSIRLNTLLKPTYGIKLVKTIVTPTESQAKVNHARNLDAGYEGSILRLNDVYQCKRSHSLRKFKDFHDAEAVLVDWVEGKGKRKGTIGKFIAIDADGNQFGMPVMDNFKKLQTMFKEMQGWVGKEATFTYFERTKASSYRHPLFKAIRDYE